MSSGMHEQMTDDPSGAIDVAALDFMLTQFRYVEGMVHEHLKELDDKARGSFTISSLIAAALSLGVGSEDGFIRFADTWLQKTLLGGFVVGLLITFGAGVWAMRLRPASITPNPHTTWRHFVTKSEAHFKYAVTQEMARNHREIRATVAEKELLVQRTNFGLTIQVIALAALVMISVYGTEPSMSEESSQTSQPAAESTPTGDSSSPAPTSQDTTNQFAGVADGVDMSIPLKKSTGDEYQTQETPIQYDPNRPGRKR